MLKITQQDLESWKSALTPTPCTLITPYWPSLPRPAAMDGKWKRFVTFTRNFSASHWAFIPRSTNPRHTTTLWLFCIFPSARGIDPDRFHVVMSPPGAAQRELLGWWGWDFWRLLEAGHSVQQLMLMEMLPARRTDWGMESAPATFCTHVGTALGVPSPLQEMDASFRPYNTRLMKFEKERETVAGCFRCL